MIVQTAGLRHIGHQKSFPPQLMSSPSPLGAPEHHRSTQANGGEVWGSDYIADVLRALDIPFLALVPGSSFRGLHDSIVNHLQNRAPELLLCTSEETAVSIAHGYAKVTDRPMAAALHANVGLMRATMGVYNAWCDRVPMLIIGATGPWDAARRRPWIDWIHTSADQGALVRDFTKWDNQPGSAAAAGEALLRGMQITGTAPRGPVYINLDVSLQETRLNMPLAVPDAARYLPPHPSKPRPGPSPKRPSGCRLQSGRSFWRAGCGDRRTPGASGSLWRRRSMRRSLPT
jgi:thiamine pyrophosphate-dependent acetolactate synthase large subunit-like protein